MKLSPFLVTFMFVASLPLNAGEHGADIEVE